MRTVSQGEVSPAPTGDIDVVGVAEALRVVVCRDDPQDDALTPTNQRTTEVDIRGGRSYENAHQPGVAQQLLDRLLHESRLLIQKAPFPRMPYQGKPGIPKDAGHGLRKGNES